MLPASAASGEPTQQQQYKLAHMSFASPSPGDAEESGVASPPPPPDAVRSSSLQQRVGSAGRPSSRGGLSSASGSRPAQPVIALPLNGTAGRSPLSDEDLSPPSQFAEHAGMASPPATVARTRSLSRNSSLSGLGPVPSLTAASMAAANAAAGALSPPRGQESFRNPRVKSASAAGNGAAKQMHQQQVQQAQRVPLSQLDGGDEDDDNVVGDARGGLALPPRPMSVDAPQRPAASSSSASAAAALSASLPFPSADAMMEDLCESFKLLHYETRLCARAGLPWISRDYFVHDFHALRLAQLIATKHGKPAGALVAARVAAITEAEGQDQPSRVAVSLSANPPCPAPTPSQQLLYFGWLVLWLLSFLQRGVSRSGDPLEHEALAPLHEELRSWRPYADYRDADEGESDARCKSLAEAILAQIAQARLPPCPAPLSAAALSRSPSGPALLQPLYRLTQSVYYAKLHGSVVLSPLAMRHYPVFEPNPAYAGDAPDAADEDEVEEEVEEEAGAAAMGEPQEENEAEGEAAADDYFAFPAPGATTAPASALSDEALWAARDAAAREWLAEHSRLAESGALSLNLARIPPAGQREWKRHQELVAKHAEALLQSPLLTAPVASGGSALGPTSLSTRAAELRRLLERISLFERRLHTEGSLASSRTAFVTARDRLDELEALHGQMAARAAEDAAELARAEEELAAKQEELQLRKDSLDDGQGLRGLRRAIGNMRQEIKRFDVLLGIKSALLQQHLQRAQANRHAPKS